MVSQEDQIYFTVFNCVAFIHKVLKPRNRCNLTSSLDLSITLTVLFGVRSLKRSICSPIKWFQRCYFTVYSQCLVIQTELHKKMLLGLNFHKPCGIHSNEVKNVNQTWSFVSLFTNLFSIQIRYMWRHHNGSFSQTVMTRFHSYQHTLCNITMAVNYKKKELTLPCECF